MYSVIIRILSPITYMNRVNKCIWLFRDNHTCRFQVAAILKYNMAAKLIKICMQLVTIGFLAPNPPNYTFRLNPKVIANVDFKRRPFWNPAWRLSGKIYAMHNVTIGFLAPKNIHLDTRIKSIAALDQLINKNEDFKWRPYWNPRWRLSG